MRRGFLWRTGCLAFATLLVGSVGIVVLVWHIGTALGLPAGGAGGVAIVTLLGVIALLGAGLAGRGIRGFAVPLGDLIDASGRVEAGDYAARVPERPWGPPPVRALVRAFNGMVERLQADERERRTLVADISHELRTPLAVLQGELEAMLDGVHPADGAHLLAALDETRVLTRLVDDLRTLALAEAGTLALHREPTDPALLVADVAAALRPAYAAAEVSVVVEAAAELPLLDIDPVRVREVLLNLLGNALRYAPAGTAVRVAVTRAGDGGALRFAVSDAGPGISPELLPHVFERFAKSGESRGSGLGLAIARQLVEAHGGRIAAESSGAGGTTIWFELPMREPSGGPARG